MLKNNKKLLILSSLLILLPMIVGLLLWNTLPDAITTHWGANGTADGWSGKTFTVFGLPLIFLAFHWFCVLATCADPKNKTQSPKVFGMVLWIIPIASNLCSALVYTTALGHEINPLYLTSGVIGFMFILFGNYFPKCRQNSTIGIKVKWTLLDEENWNRTHRFASKLWVIGGIIIHVALFLPETAALTVTLLVFLPLTVAPIIYSYLLYRKTFGTTAAAALPSPYGKRTRIIVAVFLILLIVFTVLTLFTGNIDYQYDDTSFTIRATYWDDITIDYNAIDSIEYRDTPVSGSRTNGFGSPRLLLGTFRNDEFDYYTRYTYATTSPCLILHIHDKILVLNAKDAPSTEVLYNTLITRISK